MRPDPGTVLMGVTKKLMTDVIADARTPFGQAIAGYAGALTMVLAQEVDGLADRLFNETEAVAEILRDALPLLEADLAHRTHHVIDGRGAPDLRISSLQAANDRVRAALIEVHAAVEALDTPEAIALNERIWDELRESTRRRHVALG
jgi:hypothetical protein